MKPQAAKLPRVPEKAVQQHIVQLLRTIGAQVWVLGTTRSTGRKCPACAAWVPSLDMGTRQTPGIPDIYAILPHVHGDVGDKVGMWIECKASGGRPSPEQRQFALAVVQTGTPYVMGDLDDIIALLIQMGRLDRKNVPHYRLPAPQGEGR